MVRQHNSSKKGKRVLPFEDDVFSAVGLFGAYCSTGGYTVPGCNVNKDSEGRVFIVSNGIQALRLIMTKLGVNSPCEVSEITVGERPPENAMINAWR